MDSQQIFHQVFMGAVRGVRTVAAGVGGMVHQVIRPVPMSQYIPKEILGALVLVPALYVVLMALRAR